MKLRISFIMSVSGLSVEDTAGLLVVARVVAVGKLYVGSVGSVGASVGLAALSTVIVLGGTVTSSERSESGYFSIANFLTTFLLKTF